MEKKTNPTWEYFKLILFVIGWIELFLFFISVLWGRILGYQLIFMICFWIGVIIGIVFLSIILFNLLMIGLQKLFKDIIK